MFLVIYPCLDYARDGTAAMRPHAPVPQLKIEKFDDRKKADEYRKQKERHAPPNTVMVVNGQLI